MARKARQRISYVLPLSNSPGGHLLGVNGLAVDHERSLLYSGGRDGVICAWNFSLDPPHSPKPPDPFASPDDPPSEAKSDQKGAKKSTTWRGQVQAHTHWINDIVLAHDNNALVSASSDLTVKVWRPHASDHAPPETIGLHSDYVKCVSAPNVHSQWVASGGLDHKICLWDLDGNGLKLQIDAGESQNSAKGSVYALSVGENIMASGGPESIVRVWDPRTGKRITSFVGHTDNVRDILINDYGDTILTASSDQTVKVWSVTAGRCMHTLTMHNDSVWSLYSEHPQLSTFYSSDRAGLVAKSDVRGTVELNEGLCVAVCQEHEGVSKVVSSGDYIWTATSNSSINRWADVDTSPYLQTTASRGQQKSSAATSRRRTPSQPQSSGHGRTMSAASRQLPPRAILQLSNTAIYSTPSIRGDVDGGRTSSMSSHARKGSDLHVDESDAGIIVPVRSLPDESIEGQHGLIKHIMLNDRRRVLTLDTAGEVVLWDLVKCEPVQSFGKRHLEDVAPELNTTESVANWCAVDTRTGRLTCVLEENYCFDAETYADELELPEPIDFREDQRINLGKWVLRYLFANLIDEEIRRDDEHRKTLGEPQTQQDRSRRENAPSTIQLPSSTLTGWTNGSNTDATPRANGINLAPVTPGLMIGVATPAAVSVTPKQDTLLRTSLPATAEDTTADAEKRASQHSQARSSSDRSQDYFSTAGGTTNSTQAAPVGSSSEAQTQPKKPGEEPDDRVPIASAEVEKDGANASSQPKESGTLFGKKFRMSFGSKKAKGTAIDAPKPVAADEKAEESDASNVADSNNAESVTEDNFLGLVQQIRNNYKKTLKEAAGQPVTTEIAPSMANETPVLKIPPATTVIIQEDRPDTGGVADLYRGTVGSVGRDADIVETAAPRWLGNLLLWNQIPVKETVKVSFILQPYQDLLPSIASADGNARLNANRMLRARKILGYVAERIEPQPERPDPDALKPEDYLELYCQNQLVPKTMTLATLRAHVWKTGGDVLLCYKSNGRKPIPGERTAEEVAEEREKASATTSA